jgi:quercetin dioxygenase-like cupin family protein
MPSGPAAAVGATVVDHLRAHHGARPEVVAFEDRLRAVASYTAAEAMAGPHAAGLAAAVGELCASSESTLSAVGVALAEHGDRLCWRVDDGAYYAPDAPVGDGYRLGNMHAVLAEGDDFAMGLFLLTPDVDYLDHRHAAPELYLNLTGPSRWRFGFGSWQEMPAGSVVWNHAGRIHATRSGTRPWLSFWAWLDHIDEPCEVVPSPG